MRKNNSFATRKLVTTAVLSVIIIILQFLGYVIKTNVSISLVLVPVVIGAALYGPSCGAFLGGVFGIITSVGCIIGLDFGGAMLLAANPVLTIALCIVKGIAAGLVAGLLYRLIAKKNGVAGIIVAAASAPVVNTGIFCLAMALFYTETLKSWAGGSDILVYVFTGLIGINFIVEFLINVILCPIIAGSLKITKKQ